MVKAMQQEKEIFLRLEYKDTILYEIQMDSIKDPVTIGRGKDNLWQLPVDDQSASTHHARILKKRKKLLLEDLKSRNGIYYLGQRINGSIKLEKPGVYGIGDCKLIMEVRENSSSSKKEKEEFHRLEQLSGAEKGKIYNIKQPFLWIGADRDCEIQIPDSVVSRKHARIQNKPDGTCWICDGTEDGKPSRNGTKVNQMPVTTTSTGGGRMLQDGDIVSVAYVDYRFWDKNVVHVRSNFFIKLLTVILTLAVVLGGYFGVRALMQDSQYFYEKAKAAAAAENFELAIQLLDQAADARGADDEDLAYARAKLRADIEGDPDKNIPGWRDTCSRWRQIERRLENENDYSANEVTIRNELVAICDGKSEHWDWSYNSKSEMKKANTVKELLLAMCWEQENFDSAEKIDAFEKERSLVNALLTAQHTYPAVKKDADAYLNRLNQVIENYNNMTKALDDYKSLENTAKFLAVLEEYSSDKQVRLIRNYCAPRKEIVATIAACRKELAEECEKIARFEFDNLKTWKMPELLVEEEKKPELDKNLKDRIVELNELMKMKDSVADSIKRYKETAENSYGAVLSLDQSGGYPYPEWLDEIFNDDNRKKMLSCDVLDGPYLKGEMRNEKSMYDKILGVTWFYDFLDGCESGKIPQDSDRLLCKCKNFYDFAELVLKDTDHDDDEAVPEKITVLKKILASANGENKLLLFKGMLENAREERVEYIYKLESDREDMSSTREKLIACGVILFLDGKFKDESCKHFKDVLNAIRNINDNAEILKQGLPGNKKVNQAWKEKATDNK